MGWLVTADPLFNNHREHVLSVTARHSIPAIYQWRDFVTGGGLMSYGPSIIEAYRHGGECGKDSKGRQTGRYTGRSAHKISIGHQRVTATQLGLTLRKSCSLLRGGDRIGGPIKCHSNWLEPRPPATAPRPILDQNVPTSGGVYHGNTWNSAQRLGETTGQEEIIAIANSLKRSAKTIRLKFGYQIGTIMSR